MRAWKNSQEPAYVVRGRQLGSRVPVGTVRLAAEARHDGRPGDARRCRGMRAVAMVVWLAQAVCGLEFYVSPAGDDTWSGRLADANEARTDGPFRTLAQAREAVRAVNAEGELTESIEVVIRGGLYALAETFSLGPGDSGTAAHHITYRAYEGERPVLVGARRIRGWQPGRGLVWTADLGANELAPAGVRQLFFAGSRQPEARYPNIDPRNPVTGGWAYVDSRPAPAAVLEEVGAKRAFRMRPEDRRQWARLDRARVNIFPGHEWWNNIVSVESYDAGTGTVTVKEPCSYEIKAEDRYFVSGMLEELDAPGEWCVDLEAGALHFRPPSALRQTPVYVPVLRTILSIEDARHLTIRGLTFRYCDGHAVHIRNSEHCVLAGCTIEQVGDYHGSGVVVSGGHRCSVVGCDIADTGHSGISLRGGDQKTLTPAGHAAENNWIRRTGALYKQGAGISIHGVGNRASRNTIHHVPRWAIGFGGNRHIIELNHLHHVSLETSDTGAIYGGSLNWLSAHGTVIRHNYIHDVIGCGRRNGEWRRPFYAWGIYLDWTAMGVTVSGNIISGAPRGGIMVHDGRFNRIVNNVVVDCGGGSYDAGSQIEASGWHTQHFFWERGLGFGWVEQYESVADQAVWHRPGSTLQDPRQAALPDGRTMHGNRFERNILFYRHPEAQAFRFRNVSLDHNLSDRNLVWHGGQPIRTGVLLAREIVGANLIEGGGFEESAEGRVAAGWSARLPNERCSVSAVEQGAHSGRRCLRLEGVSTPETAGNPPWARHVMARCDVVSGVQPGHYYRLSCRLKGKEANTSVLIEALCFKAGVFDVRFSTRAAVDSEWTQAEVLFQLPPEGSPQYHPGMEATFYVRVRLAQDDGVLWLDDVDLREFVPMDEWEAWQHVGMDRNSLVSDPLFMDLDNRDFRPRPGSPAWSLGFEAIPVARIGCYRAESRASWPVGR